MNTQTLKLFFIAFFFFNCISIFSQEKNDTSATNGIALDTLNNIEFIGSGKVTEPSFVLTRDEALRYMKQAFRNYEWHDSGDSLILAIEKIIFEASHPSLRSIKKMFVSFPFDSLAVKSTQELKRMNIDTLRASVTSLIKYITDRDSTIINFKNIGNTVTPVYINSKSGQMVRFWLKNEFSDSVAVWIGNSSEDTIGLYLEKGVSLRRPVKQFNYSGAKVNGAILDNSKLLVLQNMTIKPQLWKYRTETSLSFNQAALSNWVKGGENSISSAMDITAYSEYSNKEKKLSSINFVRLKLGFLQTGTDPVRKNIDLLESNSKLNHKAFGRFDFSAVILFKTQIAVGKNYFKTIGGEDSSVVVSNFLNPSILTMGIGLDYKPDKKTSINFSPLSYKGTFITNDRIDGTKYGIMKNHRALNEAGLSFIISNEIRPIESVAIKNRLQLFSNYIHNPQNIDIDWEMIATAKINWFTEVRFNTQLIFDDDTKTVDIEGNKPVKRPDGTEKKTARLQFKEMLGLSLFFLF